MEGDRKEVSLTLNGSGFTTGSQVKWNTTNLSTSYSSPNQLTAVIPVGNLNTAGPISITVQNPDPNGGTSGAINFTVISHFPKYEEQLAK
jgi:hypothetical protein